MTSEPIHAKGVILVCVCALYVCIVCVCALCVFMHTCACKDKRAIHNARQMLDTLVRQGGKPFVMVL